MINKQWCKATPICNNKFRHEKDLEESWAIIRPEPIPSLLNMSSFYRIRCGVSKRSLFE